MDTKVHNDLEDAFGRTILAKAREFVRGYRIILERNAELGYIGNSVELPTVFADDKELGECYRSTEEALIVAVATLIEEGRKPPLSSLAKRRTEQVNMRLTPDEKLRMKSKADALGYKGISDFVRHCAIEGLLKTS